MDARIMKNIGCACALLATLSISTASARAQTILADSYLTSLDVAAPTTLAVTPNFPSFLVGPLTGSSDLTITGYFSSASVSAITNPLSLVNNAGNTFSGNIIIDGSALRIAGSPFATSGGGFVAGSMTSSDTITINRAGIFHIDDNVSGGYTANRFGTSGDRPAVNLAGGTFNLNGLNNASSSVQTFGALTSSSGQGTIAVFRNGAGNPTLTFSSLAITSGSLLTFNGTNLGTGTNDSRITFTAAPTLTNNILAGARFYSGAAGTSDFVTYGVNGVTTFTAYDLSSNDINGATSTQNVNLNGGPGFVALSANRTVNSLNISGTPSGPWSLGGFTLTIGSGMLLRTGNNSDPNIQTGTLTAGDGVNDIDLNIIVAQNNMTIGAVIADNSASAVTLVKSGDSRSLTLNGGANNTYTGGTDVVGGTLSTGNVANRTYLGTGAVTVDGASALTLGAIGATSNATGADYTAQNGGQINIATAAYTSADTFDIKANSVISGGVGVGTGLNSLDRGIGGGTPNITLATNSVIGHSTVLTGALNLTTGTIKNLGTSADLYYGLTNDQNNAGGQITIGNGTAFKGISSVSSGARAWNLGTINVATGTTDVYFQGLPSPVATPTLVAFGNGVTAGGPVVSLADVGTLDVNVLGNVQINDDAAVFGNTGTGRNVQFVVTEGSTLTVATATGMGSGTGIAAATVKNGGTLGINNAAAINGAVTIEAGGVFTQSQATLTGTGTFTHTNGSILNLTNTTSVSGATQDLGTVAGTIVRMATNPTSGTSSGGVTQFDARLNDAAIYQWTAGITFTNAASATDSLLTLNSSGGIGGILTNDLVSRGNTAAIGRFTIGANGGTMAATTNTTLSVAEDSILNGSLALGSTAIIDGAPKLGAVTISGAIDLGGATRTISAVAGTGTLQITGVISNGGLTKDGAGTLIVTTATNTYAGGTTVDAGTLQLGSTTSLGSTSGQLTVNTGGTLNMSAVAQTVGNLTGTGGIINAAGRILTIGQGDTGGGNYQGSIQGASAALTKVGTGTITLSGVNTYTGLTTVSAGTLVLGNATNTIAGAVTVSGGTLALGSNSDTVGVVTLTSGSITSTTGVLTGSSYAVQSGSASAILGGTGVTLTKSTGGTVTLTGANTYTGLTAISAGTLTLSGNNTAMSGGVTLNGNVANTRLNINSATALGTGTFVIQSGNLASIDNTSGVAITLTTNNVQTWSNDVTFVGSNNLNLGTGNVTMGGTRNVTTSAGTLTVGGAISGVGFGVNKSGTGTLALNGASTYSGATNVNAGTLLVNNTTGSGTGSGTVTVGASGTLGGTGTISGATTVNGTLAPGNSPGVLAFSGTLTLTGTTITEIDGATRGTQYDGVNTGAGLLTYGGGLSLDFGTVLAPDTYTFDLFNIGAGGQTGNFSSVSLSGSYTGSLSNMGGGVWQRVDSGNTWTFSQATGDLTFIAVPEPGTIALAACGLIGVAIAARRRLARRSN